MIFCKNKYTRIANKEAEEKLDKLLAFCIEHNCGHVTMLERWAGNEQYVQVAVDIKVSATEEQRKKLNQLKST